MDTQRILCLLKLESLMKSLERAAQITGICIVVTLLFSLKVSPQPAGSPRSNNARKGQNLSAEELFKRLSPAVFVIEALDETGQTIAQGSGVVIQVPDLVGMVNDPIFQKFSAVQQREALTRLTDDKYFDDLGDRELHRFVSLVRSDPRGAGRPPHETYVITNRHVVVDGVMFRVRHGDTVWFADLVGFDADNDLAELRVQGLESPSVVVRESSALEIGEQVYALGAPEGFELTISQGLISGLRGSGDDDLMIQTSAAISPGSSGGGLFDSEGRLVGITSAYVKDGQNLNFAIPAEKASRFAESVDWDASYDALMGTEWELRGILFLSPALPDEPPSTASLPASERDAIAAAQYRGAAGILKRAVYLDPDNVDAWKSLGQAYFQLGQGPELGSTYQKLKTLDPKAAEKFFNQYLSPK